MIGAARACALSVLLAGCSSIELELPDQFLVVQTSSVEFKATTADDSLLWVRKYQLPERGTSLDFWVSALKQDFVGNRGYTLLAEEPIVTKAGVEGHQMTYEATTHGRTFRYLIAVFIHPGPTACIATFTAEKPAFDRHAPTVKDAILTTRT